jgi:lipopolysaccharide export LptBFGC system permease protein LptF
VAISFSPLVFALLALSMMIGGVRRRWMLGIAVCVLFVGWSALRGYIVPWGRVPLAPYAAAWVPEGAILATAALIAFVDSYRQRTRRLQTS